MHVWRDRSDSLMICMTLAVFHFMLNMETNLCCSYHPLFHDAGMIFFPRNPFDDLCCFVCPTDQKICPSSVSKFFESKSLPISPVPWCVRTQYLNVRTPALDSGVVVATEESCGREELWEWLGAMACGIDM